MYTLEELLDKINVICQDFDECYDLNSGGCCFAASIIAKYLDKYDIEYYLVVNDCFKKNRKSVINEIKNRKLNRLVKNSITGYNSCNHYYLFVPAYGDINNNDGERTHSIIIKVNHKDIAWIYKKGDWNSCYDTDNNKEFINLIKSIFENYEKS